MSAFAFMSVSVNRLQWLINEIHSGRTAHVSFSYNQSLQREKVKFVVEDSYQSHQVYRPCLLAALSAVRFAFESSITTDKGHRSSLGRTTVEFWLQQPPLDTPITMEAAADLTQSIDHTTILSRADYASGPMSTWSDELDAAHSEAQVFVCPSESPAEDVVDKYSSVSNGASSLSAPVSPLPLFDSLEKELSDMRTKLEDPVAQSVSTQPVLDMADRLLNDTAGVHDVIVKLPTTMSKRGEFLDRSSSLIGQMKVAMSRMPGAIENEGGVSVFGDLDKQLDSIISHRDELLNDIRAAMQSQLDGTGSSSKQFKLRKKLCDNPKSKKQKR